MNDYCKNIYIVFRIYCQINNQIQSNQIKLEPFYNTMIIPIKCVSCGTVLADKYRYYLEQVRKEKVNTGMDVDRVVYYSKSSKTTEKSPEVRRPTILINLANIDSVIKFQS